MPNLNGYSEINKIHPKKEREIAEALKSLLL